MARKPEAQYTTAIKKLLPPSVYALKLSLPYTAGVPDNWYSGPSRDLWLEWKYLQKIPPVIDCTKLLTPLQQQWLTDRHAEGRNVAVGIGSRAGGVILHGLRWQTPMKRDEFLERAQQRRAVAGEIARFVST